MTEEIQFPEALKYVANDLQEKLTQFQIECNTKLTQITVDTMKSLGLSSEDGWRADVQNQRFIKVNNAPITDDLNTNVGEI